MILIKLIVTIVLVLLITSSSLFISSSSSSRWLLRTSSPSSSGISSTSLSSSQLLNILPPERFFGDDNTNPTGDESLDLLISKNDPLIMTIEELQVKWIDLCIEKSRPQDIDLFSLSCILPFIIRDDSKVQLINKTDEILSESSKEIYITETELQRLWHEKASSPFGKSTDSFKIEDALLLLEDDEDSIIIGNNDSNDNDDDNDDDNSSLILKSSLKLNTNMIANDLDSISAINDLYITEDELKRIWTDKYTVWGMPSKEFNIKDALLYLDDEEDGSIDSDGNKIEYVNSFYSDLNAKENFLKRFDDEKYDDIRDEVQQIYDYIEDTSYYRPPWKKSSNFLTPDIDTQAFMGDIMSTTNTYQWSRIPANYQALGEDESNSVLADTDSLALPGEPETDFTITIPIWDHLDLPFRPRIEEVDLIPPIVMADDVVKEQSGPIDWSNPDVFNSLPKDDDSAEALDINSFFEGLADGNEKVEVSNEPEEWGLDTRRGYDKESICRDWKTPPEWLTNPEFANHVGFETWSEYDDDDYLGADEKVWEEDICTAQCIKHVLDITDFYLNDQQKLSEEIDDHRQWDRLLHAKLSGDTDPASLKETIAPHLEPFKYRGLNYTNEIIEMKGKKVLSAYLDPPAVMWENDTFVHNEKAVTMNKVGIIREQYDWSYSLNKSQYEIDNKIVEKLGPLIQFCNHIADLKSTKDNILVFEYYGMIRTIVGIRSMMIQIARECYPDVVDVRLETDKTHDKNDI